MRGVKKSKPNLKAVLAGSALGAGLGSLLILSRHFHLKWVQALFYSLIAYALFTAFLAYWYWKHKQAGEVLSAENIERDRQDVAELIEGLLQGRLGTWDWHDFLAGQQRVSELEQIREACAALPQQFPPEKPGDYCNPQGMQVLRDYLKQLRDESKEVANP